MRVKLLVFLVVIFAFLAGIFSQDLQNFFQKDSKTKIFYAKAVSRAKTDNSPFPIWKVYESSLFGRKKEIFSVDTESYLPRISFNKKRDIFLVDLQHSLLIVDRITGKKKLLFSGDKSKDPIFGYKDSILGYAVSHDGKKLALTYSQSGQRIKILTIDINSGSQKLLLSSLPIEGRFFLAPNFWSFDDKKIYLIGQIQGADELLRLWSINEDGTSLKKIHITEGKAAEDGSKYAYTGLPGWQKPGFPIKIFDFVENNEIVIGDSSSLFRMIAWSPDSTKLLYSFNRYKSEENGLFNFYPDEKTFVYDTLTNDSKKIESKEKQLRTWFSDKLDIQQDRETGELRANQILIDKAYEPDKYLDKYFDKYLILYVGSI